MLKRFLRSIMSYAIVFLLVFCSSVKYAHATDESDNTVERYDSRLSYSYCAQLIGVITSGHDHSTWMIHSKASLQATALTNVYTHYSTFSITDIQHYLDYSENNVFISRSHGTDIKNSYNVQIGTAIQINNNTTGNLFSSNSSMDSLNLSNMGIILFIGCKTGSGGSSGANLPTKSVAKGALCTVGFTGNIGCASANNWTEAFCNYMANHKTVSQACSLLAVSYSGTGLNNYYIAGSGSAGLS